MPDQHGGKCALHDPKTCFCDERRDRERGVHRPGGLADAFGGYECVCGDVRCPGGRFPFAETPPTEIPPLPESADDA